MWSAQSKILWQLPIHNYGIGWQRGSGKLPYMTKVRDRIERENALHFTPGALGCVCRLAAHPFVNCDWKYIREISALRGKWCLTRTPAHSRLRIKEKCTSRSTYSTAYLPVRSDSKLVWVNNHLDVYCTFVRIYSISNIQLYPQIKKHSWSYILYKYKSIWEALAVAFSSLQMCKDSMPKLTFFAPQMSFCVRLIK